MQKLGFLTTQLNNCSDVGSLHLYNIPKMVVIDILAGHEKGCIQSFRPDPTQPRRYCAQPQKMVTGLEFRI